MSRRILANEEIEAVEISVPEGHRHLRTVLQLAGGEELVLQEATVANLVRAYLAIKTHPQRQRVRLVGRGLGTAERKEGFASWQLLEEE